LQFSQILEIAKIVLECLIVVLGWIFLRRLEQIKSEVARHSDFNQKWADLFFEASNAIMVSVEHIMTYAFLATSDKDGSSPRKMEWQQEMNKALEVFLENQFRIQRLAVLATSKGSNVVKAADDLFTGVRELFNSKRADVQELRAKIDMFNLAARKAHAEMIASR
jgi:hypothetical protein